jgi:hypothetical protein
MAMSNDAGAHQGEPAAAASGDIPTVGAPSIAPAADPSAIAHDGDREQPKAETAPAPAAAAPAPAESASDAKAPPAMPRAAVLVLRPDDKPGATAPEAAGPASARASGRRFALLAAGLTLAAALGAIAGSAGIAGLERLVVAPPAAPAVQAVATRSEPNDEVRVLKETVAQLRMNVKTLSDNLSALRTTINSSTSAATAQFTKITEALDRVEHARVERHVTTLTPSPEPTGSIAASPAAPAPAATALDPKAAPKPAIVEGWTLRKVYGGEAALVEGRYGIVEIGPGDLVPGLGRIQEIKRQQDGHWAVMTSRGMIVSPR